MSEENLAAFSFLFFNVGLKKMMGLAHDKYITFIILPDPSLAPALAPVRPRGWTSASNTTSAPAFYPDLCGDRNDQLCCGFGRPFLRKTLVFGDFVFLKFNSYVILQSYFLNECFLPYYNFLFANILYE